MPPPKPPTRSLRAKGGVAMDFGAFPPEFNSARMYAGPGSGPMLAAASAWDVLAAELGSAASSYGSVVSSLAEGSWLGPASASMAAAAGPYVDWMSTTAAPAEQTGYQARSAAAAYDAAFGMTVPPAVVAANRAQLAALVATNVIGQNTPAIAATEAHHRVQCGQPSRHGCPSHRHVVQRGCAVDAVAGGFFTSQRTTGDGITDVGGGGQSVCAGVEYSHHGDRPG